MTTARHLVLGKAGEDAAAAYLAARGYTVLARNYRTRYGEIDIVAEKGDVLAFVEVKTRESARFGAPRLAVDARRQKRLCDAALMYLTAHAAGDRAIRFDVIEDESGRINHIEDAFRP